MTLKELNSYGELAIKNFEIEERLRNNKGTMEDKKQLKKVKHKLHNISSFILNCPDPFINQVMLLKFSQGLSWEAVAKTVSGYNSADSIRQLVNRYILRSNKNS